MKHLTVLLGLLISSCYAQVSGPYFSIPDGWDQYRILSVTLQAMEEFDRAVGARKNIPLEFCGDESCVPQHLPWTLGRCVRLGSYRFIEIYLSRLHADTFDYDLRAVYLHELVHAHLTCSDADHVDEPGQLMSLRISDEMKEPLISPELAEQIRRAW